MKCYCTDSGGSVPERCVISAHFRVRSSRTHLPCDTGWAQAALTDMERCIVGLRRERQKRMCRGARRASQPRLSFVEKWTKLVIYSKANLNTQTHTQTNTHTYLLVWRAKGVSRKPWKITTELLNGEMAEPTNGWIFSKTTTHTSLIYICVNHLT